MAGLFIWFLVEKCAACQSHRKCDFGWRRFQKRACNSPSLMCKKVERVINSLHVKA